MKYTYGHYYYPGFLGHRAREEILTWIQTLQPIWEMRYSKHNPAPNNEENRMLLRPVYWLGNWQFACLNYYHPRIRTHDCAVRAEPFPDLLQRHVNQIEKMTREKLKPEDVPTGWRLNTCLINFYGSQIIDGKKKDTARVGEHKDFEPGPVASLSIGERALIQFVESEQKGTRTKVVLEQWLDDRSLEIFGGARFKDKLFHRVQRVDKKTKIILPTKVGNFETRRINFTFRYVPEDHWVSFRALSIGSQQDLLPYIKQLGSRSDFWSKEFAQATERLK